MGFAKVNNMVSLSRHAWCSLLSLILGVGLVLTSLVPANARFQEEEFHHHLEWVARNAEVNKLDDTYQEAQEDVFAPPSPQGRALVAQGRLASEFSNRNGFGGHLRL